MKNPRLETGVTRAKMAQFHHPTATVTFCCELLAVPTVSTTG
jgi:hypothetical protein